MPNKGTYGTYNVDHKSYQKWLRFTERGKQDLDFLTEYYDCSEAEAVRRAVKDTADRIKRR